MKTYPAAEPFDRHVHDGNGFGCGVQKLDIWIRAYAGQNERRDAARTFVVADDGAIIGYYTLVAGQVEHEAATSSVVSGMFERFPVPVAVLARLAVDRAHQGQGLGRSLLLDSLLRVVRASDELGIRAIIVDATDASAASFYERYGFEPSGLDPQQLMVRTSAVRKMLAG